MVVVVGSREFNSRERYSGAWLAACTSARVNCLGIVYTITVSVCFV